MLATALAACLALGALAAVPGDLITSLPGWDGPLPSTQYSGGWLSRSDELLSVRSSRSHNHTGYFPVDGGYLHYWLILSQNNPTTDPLVMWCV